MPNLSSLQIGLLIIGAVLVIVVYVFNVVQERRIRRRIDAAFKTTADPLLAPTSEAKPESRERIEPMLTRPAGETGSGEDPLDFAGDETPAAPEPAPPEFAASAPEPGPGAAARLAPERGSPPLANEPVGGALPDADIECVARLQAVLPIPGALLMDAVEFAYAKPCRWVGRQVTGHWSVVHDAHTYTEVAACLLLADRAGPLNEQGYAAFRHVIEALGRTIPAAFVMGERDEELERAAELDAFCADVDIQIGLNLVRRDGGRWTGTRLRGVAEASGFRLNGNGQFDYMGEDSGVLLFRMHNREEQPLLAESMKTVSTVGVTLLLDVPRVLEPIKVYDQMRALTKRLAVTLDAEVVDDNGRALTDAGLGTTRAQLQTVQATMRAKGIEPGGLRALRLFG